MNILIVNNGQNPPTNFLRLFGAHDCSVVAADAIVPSYPTSSYDLIVLTGSNSNPIPYSRTLLQPLLGWISELTTPTIGICYGAELIATAFATDETLTDGGVKIRSLVEISPLPHTGWDFNQAKYLVYEAHRWNITHLASVFSPLIVSERGVLLFEHNERPIVGFQFHPEKHVNETDGTILLNACLRRLNSSFVVETKGKE